MKKEILIGILAIAAIVIAGCTQIRESTSQPRKLVRPPLQEEGEGETGCSIDRGQIYQNLPQTINLFGIEWSRDEFFNEFVCDCYTETGNPNNKINLFFISDGFIQDQEAFDLAVNTNIDWNGTNTEDLAGLFTPEVFQENKYNFSTYKIFSNQIFDCPRHQSYQHEYSNGEPQVLPCDSQDFFSLVSYACGMESDNIDFLNILFTDSAPDGSSRSGSYNLGRFSVIETWDGGYGLTLHELGMHGITHLPDGPYSTHYYVDRDRVPWWMGFNVWVGDSVGCPKWCSGIINTSAECYNTYTEWLSCVDNVCNGSYCWDEDIIECNEQAFQTEDNAGRTIYNCNIGIDCMEGTACFWGIGAQFPEAIVLSYWRSQETTDFPMYAPSPFIEARIEELISVLLNPQCSNSFNDEEFLMTSDDNYFDDHADFPTDFSCGNELDDNEIFPPAACQDGLDNDDDGYVDYPNDYECIRYTDNTENVYGPDDCHDNIDNDYDGSIDYDDFSCSRSSHESEVRSQCEDERDNDGDLFIDSNDPNCSNQQDNSESSLETE